MNSIEQLFNQLKITIKYINQVLSNNNLTNIPDFIKILRSIKFQSEKAINYIWISPEININSDTNPTTVFKEKTYHSLLEMYKLQQSQLCDKDNKIKQLENENYKLSNNKEIVVDNVIENFVLQQQTPIIIEKIEIVPQYIYLEGPVVPIQYKIKINDNLSAIKNLSKSLLYLSHNIKKKRPKRDPNHYEKRPKICLEKTLNISIKDPNHNEKRPKIFLEKTQKISIKDPNHYEKRPKTISEKTQIISIKDPTKDPNCNEKRPKIVLEKTQNILKKNVFEYYTSSNILNRLQELNKHNYSQYKLATILNDEGYIGYNYNPITRDIVRRLLKYLPT
jgi:hypothetical protein